MLQALKGTMTVKKSAKWIDNPCSKILTLISHLPMSAKRTLVDYTYNKNYAPENCNWLGIWTKSIQDSLKLC